MKRDLKRLKTDTKLCKPFSRLTSRWTSYDSPKPEDFTGMDLKLPLCVFSLFIINVFTKEKNSGCDLVIKIRFQFWEPSLRDRRRLLVLSLGLRVLQGGHKVETI